MTSIVNDGQRIAQTDYFDSEEAGKGFCFLSWNAGAARVLIPDAMAPMLTDMQAAQYVIISRGPWEDYGGRDAFELLFEDGSDAPFCLYIVAEQTDRLLPESEQGGGFVVTIWTRLGEQLRLGGRYRTVECLPCLDPWITQ